MTEEQLAALRRRWAKPIGWRVSPGGFTDNWGRWVNWIADHEAGGFVAGHLSTQMLAESTRLVERAESFYDQLAHYAEDVPALLAEVDRLRALLAPLLKEPIVIDGCGRWTERSCVFCAASRHVNVTDGSEPDEHDDDCPVLTETWAKEA